jgi:hypothetical protein
MTVPCRLAKFHGARSAGGVGTPGLQLFAPYHIFGRMPSPPRDRPKPTTPEEEGIEFYPDAWERFERTVQKVIKAPPVHRTGRTTVGARLKRKRRDHGADKTSG